MLQCPNLLRSIMSHLHIAVVWRILQRRTDVDHILLELIGQFSVDLTLYRADFLRLRSIAFQHAIALKTIFDLQRTYLQSSNPSFESRSALVRHDLLFAAVIHLLDIKAETFRSAIRVPDYYAYCSFLAQALLSGLRALSLQKKTLTSREYDTLTNKFDQVWRDERLENVDLFVVQSLCRRLIQELCKESGESKYGLPACGSVELPDFSHKLYPVEIHTNSVVIAAQNARSTYSGASDWFENALILYDIYWSTLAAMIQLHADFQERKEIYRWTTADEFEKKNEFISLLTTRFNILNQIYNNNDPRCSSEDDQWINEQMKTVLLLGTHPSCSKDQCLCFNDVKHDMNDLRMAVGAQELSAHLDRYLAATRYISGSENALKQFHLTLNSRVAAHFDCTGELEDLSQKLHAYLQDWCPNLYPTGYDDKHEFIRDELFVVACPELHVLPARLIQKGLLEASGEGERLASNTPSAVSVPPDLKCPYCIPEIPAIVARKIVPISRISSQIQRRLQVRQELLLKRVMSGQTPTGGLRPERDTDFKYIVRSKNSTSNLSASTIVSPTSPRFHLTNLDDFPEVVNEQAPQATPRPKSIISEHSGSGSNPLSPVIVPRKTHTWQNIFKTNRGSSSHASIPSFAFFSCGKKLLLWNERGFGFYDLREIDSISFRRLNSFNTRIAAGGTNTCAIISKISTDYTLLVFRGDSGNPVFQSRIEGSPFAIAVSRNDQYIALKFSRFVLIFDTISTEFVRHELPYKNNRSGLNNNLVSFSSDSSSFIASTRYEPEKVITYWSECTIPSKTNCVESSAPFGLVGDDGLSSVVYSGSSSQWAFLATFTEKGFPVFFNLSDSRAVSQPLRDNSNQIGARIHRATLCAAGTNLVMINQRNDVFWIVDASGMERGARRVANIKRSLSVKREVEMGMPSTDEVHVFWIEKGQGKLVTVGKLGGKSKPLALDIDMAQLVS